MYVATNHELNKARREAVSFTRHGAHRRVATAGWARIRGEDAEPWEELRHYLEVLEFDLQGGAGASPHPN